MRLTGPASQWGSFTFEGTHLCSLYVSLETIARSAYNTFKGSILIGSRNLSEWEDIPWRDL